MKAAEVPLGTLEKSVNSLSLALEMAQLGTRSALSDVVTAAEAARAAVEGAASNVLINLRDISNAKFVETASMKVSQTRKEALQLESEARRIVDARLENPALVQA